MSHVVAQLLKRGRSLLALRRIFEKLKDASDVIRKRALEIRRDFKDNFPTRLLRPFDWPFTNGREFKFKKFCLLNLAPVATGLTLGLVF